MNQAGHLAAMLRLDGHHKAAAADGDDGILQQLLIGGGTDHFVQLLPYPGGGGPHFAADICQGGGGVVRDLFLRRHDGADPVLQIFVGHEDGEAFVQGSIHPRAMGAPLHHGPDDPQGFRDIQQLPQRKRGPRPGAAQGVGYIFDLPERGAAESGHQHVGIPGFRQQTAHLAQFYLRFQPPGHGGGIGTAGFPGQQIENFIQFQCFIMAIHHLVKPFRYVQGSRSSQGSGRQT